MDSGQLISNTDQSSESRLLELLATQLAKANEIYNTAIDLMYAYANAALEDETVKLTGFSSGDQLSAFIKRLYGLKGLPNFFTQQMSLFSKELVLQRYALIYVDNFILKSSSKPDLLQFIEKLHDIAEKRNPKSPPKKFFFMLLTVNILGHETDFKTMKAD